MSTATYQAINPKLPTFSWISRGQTWTADINYTFIYWNGEGIIPTEDKDS